MNNENTNSASQLDRLDHVLTWLSALPVALIVVLTFADVFWRYVFSSPIRGNLEMIEYAMALVIFTALPRVTRQRGHVTVSLIEGLVKGQAQRIKTVLCDAISAFALGVLTWRLGLQGLENLNAGASTVVLNLSHAPLSFVLTAFAGLSTLVVLMQIWKSLNKESAPS